MTRPNILYVAWQASRPDFRAHLAEFALSVQDNEPFTVLARSGGRRTTDKLEVFAPPQVTPEGAEGFFLVRGVRHVAGSEVALQDVVPGTVLYVKPEPTNSINPAALLVWSGRLAAMKVDTISEAKAQLSALVDRALAGEEVIIGRAGKPAVRLVPLVQRAEQRRPGTLKGQIHISADFDELPADIAERLGMVP